MCIRDSPYIVTGILTPPGVRVARITGADMAAVSLADTMQHPFSTARDAIGFDWKTYSFDNGVYTCLLYTSDAADERSSVDLGGRRIIKKKNKLENRRHKEKTKKRQTSYVS